MVMPQDLIAGGFGLSMGSSIIEKLPASAAKTGVQSGLGTAGSFFPVMTTIHMGGFTTNQLRNLKGGSI